MNRQVHRPDHIEWTLPRDLYWQMFGGRDVLIQWGFFIAYQEDTRFGGFVIDYEKIGGDAAVRLNNPVLLDVGMAIITCQNLHEAKIHVELHTNVIYFWGNA